MRFFLPLCLATLVALWLLPHEGLAEKPQPIALATHNQTRLPPSPPDAQAIERIRKIVLNQGDDARALANLVQLTRKLPALTTSQLYYDLANDYLRNGKYDQAANVLQQLLNQHADQPIAAEALVTLVRLYSSSEVAHSENFKKTGVRNKEAIQGLLKYALYTADQTLLKNSALSDDPALIFQRAVTTRLGGHHKAAQGRLTRLKHNSKAGPWRTYAQAEQWLQSKREDEPPMPVVVCRRTDQSPHLDGLLDDSMWRAAEPIQFSYDDGFFYLAIAYPKVEGQSYQADSRPRTYDADLTGHDHVQIRLDRDRDYATCFELALDYRGQTNDCCWLDTSWNPKWFVAAGGDDSHWTVEGAIPWKSLTHTPPQAGEAWAVAWNRILPKYSPGGRASTPAEEFSLLIFK